MAAAWKRTLCYCTLGARLDVVEMMAGLMQGADREPVKISEVIEVTFAAAEEGAAGGNACVMPSVAYTDPKWGKSASPRTQALRPRHQGQEGPVPLDRGMVGTHAGDMTGAITWAIEMDADAVDIGKTIHKPFFIYQLCSTIFGGIHEFAAQLR